MRKLRLGYPNLKVALLYFPIAAISVPAGLIDQENDPSRLATLALTVSLLATICVSLLSLIPESKKTWLQNSFVIALLVSLGAARGYLLHEMATWLDVSVGLDQFSWIRNSIISTTGWLILLTQALSQIENKRKDFEKMFASKSLELATVGARETSDAYLESLSNISVLQANLNRIAHEARKSDLKQDDLVRAAASVRDQLEHSLRPLSHRIWFNELRNRPQFRVVAIWQEGIRSLRLYPWLSAAIAGLGFFVGASTQLPTDELFLRSILVVLLTAASFGTLRRWKWALGSLLSSLFSLLLAALVPYFVTEFIVRLLMESSFAEPITSALIPAVTNAFLAIVISTLQQMRRDWDYVLKTLNETANEPSIANLRLATYLHNSLQSELTQIAARLEMLDEGASEERDSLLRHLEEISQREIARDVEISALTPIERIAKVVAGWRGIIEISFDQTLLRSLSEKQQEIACLAIEEGIANAVRHGSAKTMAVAINETNGVTSLEMSNPYIHKDPNQSGFGTQWLERVSQGKPSIEYSDNLRIVRIQL